MDFLCSSEANVKPAREFWEELHMKHIMSGTLVSVLSTF